MHLLTLYFLDSGAYSKGFFDWFGEHIPEFIRQINLFTSYYLTGRSVPSN